MTDKKQDPLYSEAVYLVQKHQKVTLALLKQNLGSKAKPIDHKRAATLMQQMEAQGVVTPPDSSGRRKLNANWIEVSADTPAATLVAMARGDKPVPKKKAAPKKKTAAKKKAARKKTTKKKQATPKQRRTAAKKKAGLKKQATPKKKATTKKVLTTPKKALPKYHINHQSWDKDAVMEEIFARMISSSKGLANICESDPELPTVKTVYIWLSEEEKGKIDSAPTPLCDMYARAKDIQMDYMADEIIDISDNQVGSPVIVEGKPLILDGEVIRVIDGPAAQHAKLRVDSRKWLASKLKHRKYGDKLELSGDPERPLAGLSDEDLAARRKLLQKQLNQMEQAE